MALLVVCKNCGSEFKSGMNWANKDYCKSCWVDGGLSQSVGKGPDASSSEACRFDNDRDSSGSIVDGSQRPGSAQYVNQIYRANLSGGLAGLFTSSKNSLGDAIHRANGNDQEVVCVIPDTVNLMTTILYSVILVVTLLIWCPAPGYLVVTRTKR